MTNEPESDNHDNQDQNSAGWPFCCGLGLWTASPGIMPAVAAAGAVEAVAVAVAAGRRGDSVAAAAAELARV